MNPGRILRSCCTSLLFVGLVPLHAQDAKGCKDSPLITRFPGSLISSCKEADFDQADFPMPAGARKHVEGEYHTLSYTAKPGAVTPIQLFRNIETALKTAGFVLDFENSPYVITAHHGGTWFNFVEHTTGGAADRVWMYDETFVTEQQMVQEVTADAGALANALTTTGHAAVPGIFFETGKADLKPESDAALKEVAKLLQAHPALKVYVVGHTDNVGTFAGNLALSNQRAASVLRALTVKYHLASDRLQAFGCGPTAPVASNLAESGRTLNRRVELVQQ